MPNFYGDPSVLECCGIVSQWHTLPVWSNTSTSNYGRLQILQSKCLCVIGNYPRCTPIPRLHSALNVAPIHDFIYHLTDNFFSRCPAHPNPLVRSIRNYTLADLHRQYKKYIHQQPKHLLFSLLTCCSVSRLYLFFTAGPSGRAV